MEDSIKNIIYQTVGQRIKTFRGRMGLSQQEIADKTNLTRVSVVNIEAGKQRATLHLLYELSSIFNCDICDLLPKSAELDSPDLDSKFVEKLNSAVGVKGVSPQKINTILSKLNKED